MLRVNLFGVPAILAGDGTPIRLRSRKQLGVLLYLALEGREQPVSRDQLMEFFWPDVPRDRAYQSLCQAVTEIRAVLGRGAVTSVSESLVLAMPVVTDLDRLVDDVERLDLSAPLSGVDWWGGPALGHWLEATRARCRRMAEDQLREGIERFRRLGLTPRVHRCAAILYELDPLAEPAVLALADEVLLRGDVVGAIRLLRTHLARLSEALGCRPQPNVERLLRRLEVGAHPPVELVPRRLAARAPQVRPPILVARERELATLEGEWQRVRADGGVRTLLITGPGGIGKSSLIRRFAASVAARAQSVYVVSCQEIGEGIPYAATSDLAAALLLDPAVSATDPMWLSEVSRIHPVLRNRYPGVPAPMETPADTVRLRIADGLTHMLEAVAEGMPVAVLFDDMHYMDPATRGVLYLLLRRAGTLPLLLVGAARARGLEQGLTSGPLESASVAWSARVPLRPLDREGTRTLISTLAPSLQLDAPRVADRIVELSEGNPHFVEMLLSDWERHATAGLAAGLAAGRFPRDWQPPDSLRQAFQRLYDGLATAAQQILHVLAVAQRALTAEEVAEALGQVPAKLDAEALELLSRGILRLDSGALCFKNELHRAYVYFALGEEARKFLHQRFGNYLLKTAQPNASDARLEATHHLIVAGDLVAATRVIRDSGLSVVESGAPAEAECVIREILAAKRDGEADWQLVALLASSLTAQGRHAEALDWLAKCEAGILDHNTHALVGVLKAQSLQRTRLGDDKEILEAARRALTLARGATADSTLAIASQVAAEAASEAADDELLATTMATAEGLASNSTSAPTRGRVLLTQAFCLMTGGSFRQAEEVFIRATGALRACRLEADVARALNGIGICRTGYGWHVGAFEPLSESLAIARRLKDCDYETTLLGNIGLAYEEMGFLDDADQCYRLAIRASQLLNMPRSMALTHANAANLSLVRGHLDTAADLLVTAKEAAERTQLWRLAALVDLTEADLLLARGEPELAWRLVGRALSRQRGRARGIDNNGKTFRLRLHWLLATQGPERVEHELRKVLPQLGECRLADQLEVRGFVGWYQRCYRGDAPAGAAAADEISETGLRGVLGILCAVGTPPAEEGKVERDSATAAGEHTKGKVGTPPHVDTVLSVGSS